MVWAGPRRSSPGLRFRKTATSRQNREIQFPPLGDRKKYAARYNAELSREDLDALGLKEIEPAHTQRMDSIKYIDEMREVGRAMVAQKVPTSHFARLPVQAESLTG